MPWDEVGIGTEIRNVGQLLDALATVDRAKPIEFRIPGARARGIAVVESYADAIVLRSEDSL